MKAGEKFENKTINLRNDITISDDSNYLWESLGTASKPFTGTFLGNKHTISGIYSEGYTENKGFFGVCLEATITDLNLDNINFYGYAEYVGGLTAKAENTTIKRCTVDANINIDSSKKDTQENNRKVGILAGHTEKTIIKACITKGYSKLISNSDDFAISLGGMIGSGSETEVSNSSNQATLEGNKQCEYIRGIIGDSYLCTINKTSNSGNIKVYDEGFGVGGIIGSASVGEVNISNSYNIGDIIIEAKPTSKFSKVGGIIGEINDMSAIIENCYNAGIISSGGGIIGENKNGNIKNCYYDISKSNKGYVSSNSEEIGIIGKTTLEMKSEIFINLLNSDIFSKDNENKNKGYPIIQGLKCNIDYSIKIPTNQNVIVTITSNNQLQEITGWKLSEDKKKLSKEYKENIKETLIIRDLDENEKEINIGINNIDKVSPKVEIEYNIKDITKENVTVNIKTNELVQEVEGWNLSKDKKVLIKEYEENIKETITVTDIAGNEAVANIEITNIDKIKPKIEIEYSTKEMTKENVIVKIKANELVQEVEGWSLSKDKKVLIKEYEENIKETITIKDIVGHEVKANIEIKNILVIGDINYDKKIDITDLILLKRHIISGNKVEWKLKENVLKAADINEDEKVDITDMLIIKRKIIGIY